MKLFEPGKIGTLQLSNRIVFAPMLNNLVEPDGTISQRGVEYYVTRAKGGAGLIMTPGTYTRRMKQLSYPSSPSATVLDSKIHIEPLRRAVDAVHKCGAKFAVQLTLGPGRNAPVKTLSSTGTVSASVVPCFWDSSYLTKELETGEIEKFIEAFGSAATMVRSVGVDALELNCHGGYLFDQFQTALWNKRTDKYGGDLEGRLTFLLEVVRSIRKAVGRDYPLMVRYGLTHHIEGGRQVDEGLEMARKLEAAGVDALDIDSGCYETMWWVFPTTYSPRGCNTELAEQVKKVVKVPVITAGKLGYPDVAEQVLQEGKADFVAIGRGFLADPEWGTKVKEGRLDDIRPCIGDYEGCLSRALGGKYVSCSVNPSAGMEKEMAITPAAKKKTVLVIGGGPGGMEAARVAALRGHKVTLYEKDPVLGGNLRAAAVPDFKSDFRSFITYLSTQINKLGVEVRMATEVTPELIQKMKPDVVVAATGSAPIVPNIPGVDNKKVAVATDVLYGKKKAGKSVVVIGGGAIGCETALYLAQSGRKVTVVELMDNVLRDMYDCNRFHLLSLLTAAHVEILTACKVSAITDDGVSFTNKAGGTQKLKADTIVLAVGFKPDVSLLAKIKDKAPEVHAVGDCNAPNKVMGAIWEAYETARKI